MTGLEKWEEEERAYIEKVIKGGKHRVAVEIYANMWKCKYCKYHKNKGCLKGKDLEASVCLEGITEYLESEV